jgi:hypothetical protein
VHITKNTHIQIMIHYNEHITVYVGDSKLYKTLVNPLLYYVLYLPGFVFGMLRKWVCIVLCISLIREFPYELLFLLVFPTYYLSTV